MPTNPAPFQTRKVMALRWAPFICLASPRSTCTEVSVLQPAPRSQRPTPSSRASDSRRWRNDAPSREAGKSVREVSEAIVNAPPR